MVPCRSASWPITCAKSRPRWRTASPHDRRANIIENTPEATALLQEIDPVVSARSDQLAAGISDADLAVFFDVLQQVRKNAQATTGPEA